MTSFENTVPNPQTGMTLFHQLGRKRIKENVYLVISLRNDGKISIAQQIEMQAGNKMMHIFLKNAIEVDAEVLYEIRDLIDAAIKDIFENEGGKEE